MSKLVKSGFILTMISGVLVLFNGVWLLISGTHGASGIMASVASLLGSTGLAVIQIIFGLLTIGVGFLMRRDGTKNWLVLLL